MAQPSRSYPNSPHRVICTRTEIIWLDIERPGAPVLRLKHYHDDDDTLALHSAFCDGLCHTFLWSRKTPALSIYTTPAAGPMQLVLPVYNIPSPVPNMQRSGLASIHVPSRRWKKYSAPESLVLIESAADGSVYQRELVTHKMPVIPRELENGRVEHRRIGTDQPLTHLSLEDPKRFKVAHFFMLYNRKLYHMACTSRAWSLMQPVPIGLFGTIPSLHKDQADPSSLIYSPRDADDEAMHIPLEVFKAEQSYKSDDNIKEVTSFFSSGQAIDASAVSPQALTLELGRLSLSEKAASMFQISEKLLGLPTDSGNDAPSISKALQALYACDRFTRSRRTGENDDNEEAAVQTAHRFACDQVAVDLILSKDVLAMGNPTAPSAEEAEDLAMTAYDRLADLPDIEYGFFRPIDANGNPPTSDAARALLSEWTLGADPHIRPAFKNPYSQQVRDEKTANTQLKAFKSRLAQEAGMSASQPLPGPSHLRRPASTQVPQLARLTESLQESDVEQTPMRERPPMAQSQTVTTETEPETPMPFTQMMPGVHGGRPAKKKKKRTGGF